MVKSLLNVGAVLPAAGVGDRFGEKKQLKHLANKPLFIYALDVFVKCKEIAEIVVVANQNDIEYVLKEVEPFKHKKPIKVIAGGERRQDSVMKGCLALSKSVELVTIHDIVRPFVTNDLILSTISGAENSDGCIAALPSNDTIKEVNNFNIVRTIDRDKIWLAQTPQTFKKKILIEAMSSNDATDEASMVEAAGGMVSVTKGSIMKFKITTIDDWSLAEKIIYG